MADYHIDINGNVTKKKKKKQETTKQQTQKNADYHIDINGNVTKNAKDDDIAPVKETTTTQDDPVWFKAGAFDDGYQFGDATISVGATALDVAGNILRGVGNLAEGVTDLALYGVSGISSLFGADEFAATMKGAAQHKTTDAIYKGLGGEVIDEYSFFGDKMDSISQGLGYVGGIIATAGIGGAAGLGSTATTVLTTGTTFASSMGSGMGEAYDENATDGEAVVYGAMKGFVEAGTELLFGGLGKSVKALGISKGISSLDDVFAKKLSSKISSRTLQVLTDYGVKASAEGVEEVLAGIGTAVAKDLTYKSEEELTQLIKDENLLEQFITGAVVSGIAQSGDAVSSIKTDTDFITGRTIREDAVVEREVEKRVAEQEKNDKKLTNKQKNEIYDKVIEDLKKGNISTDTIEETFGGETYKQYKSVSGQIEALVNKKAELQKELYELENEPNTIGNTKRYDAIEGDIKDVEAQIENLDKNFVIKNLKSQLDQKIGNVLKQENDTLSKAKKKRNSYLSESYRENLRRGQAFEADLNQYRDNYAKQTVKNIMDSGIANNTNLTHEFADMLAKLSADQKTVFSFTDNQKLRESIFGVDGKTVNGYITKDGITINLNSPKALQTIVGHEISHVLEGTELYAPLQSELKSYLGDAEYSKRLAAMKENYKDIYKGEDAEIKFEQELTADLVGELLFTDKNFVSRLYSGNRNIFQRIFDEIKYLCRVASAGSKQARQLEKIKHTFEEVYREGRNNSITEFKHSLTEYGFEELTKESKNNLKMQGVEVIDSRDYLVKKINAALNGSERQKQFTLGAISGDTKIKIEADTKQKLFKDRQYSFIVDGDDFIHISKHFAPAEEIADEVVRLFDIVSHYDSVEFKTEGQQKKLVFEKNYPHAEIRSIEVVSNNRNSINLVTVFYTKKNRSQSNPTATSNLNGSPRWESTSINSINQKDSSVNIDSMQENGKNTLSSQNDDLLPMKEGVKAEKNTATKDGVRYSLVGRTIDGTGIYKTNYPESTPKSVKQNDLISLVQSVWSNSPITLEIVEDGTIRKIEARFNPELSERSDLSKIAFGNRKGNGSEKRMTLDLSSDLYQIASDSKYVYSKDATPKPNNPAHDNVTKYHYFLTNLVYQGNDNSYIPCYMNIDVKQSTDGNWFYSFAIEKGSAPQTLLAVVTENSATLPDNSISNNEQNVNGPPLLSTETDELLPIKEGAKAEKNTVTKDGVRYSIINLDTGKSYVQASRQVIHGNSVTEWRSQISDFFNESLKSGPIEIQTVEGDVLTISKDTASKARDKHISENGVSRELTNNEFLVKLRAESHLDELAEISVAQKDKFGNKKIVDDRKNHDIAKDGFSYRTVYFQDFDGKYYRITLSVGENGDISTVYNVGKIKTDNIPNGNIVSAIGSKADMSSAKDSITNSDENVNGNPLLSTETDELLPIKEDAKAEKNTATKDGVRYSVDSNSQANETEITYETLISKPDMKVSKVSTTVEEISGKSRQEIVDDVINKLSNLRNSDGVVKIHNKDMGKDIVVGKSGIEHGLDRGYEYTAIVSLDIESYLQNAIKINEAIADENRTHDSDILLGYGETVIGEKIPAYFVVSKLTTGQSELVEFGSLYSIRAKKIAEDSTQGSSGFRARTSAKISIAELLDIVNSSYSDILPKSVVKHYGLERKKTKLGRSIRYSLSSEGDNVASVKDGIYGKDIMLDDLPVRAQFALDEKKDNAETAGGVENNSGLSPTDNVSDNIIPETESKVNFETDELPIRSDLAKKEHITMEEFANKDASVWNNVEYGDEVTKNKIMQETHDRMVAEGSIVNVSDDTLDNVAQSFPDLRSMKKKERTQILKDSINRLKNNLRQFLGSFKNQGFEFEVNGKVLDAKLYSTGINEVTERITREKASMLYSTEEIFKNARYLYSTPDYDGDPNVYRWNYFYTPVRIGNETVGVRVAVRDIATPKGSQIYHWGIKKDASLDGVGRGTSRISHDVSSEASINIIPETEAKVNFKADGLLTADVVENIPVRSNIKSAAATVDESDSIRTQLRNSQEKLEEMEPVAKIRISKDFFNLDKTGKQNWVIEKLRHTNYKVDRKGFGIISFAKQKLKSAFNYFKKGSAEEAAFEALPYVLENGVEISNRSEHKGRGYGTVTFAAPITINAIRGNMAVTVKRTDGNYYKVHRILTPDGFVFNLSDITKETEPTPAGELSQSDSLAAPIGSVSNDIIPETESKVNFEADGLPARSDMAQRDEGANTNAISRPINSYPVEKQKVIRSYIRAVDKQIKAFVERVRNGDLRFERKKISDVSQRATDDIKSLLGIDVTGYTNNINTSGVQHIIVRHGANGKQDTTMSVDDDIARVGWVLENYDSIEKIDNSGSKEFRTNENIPAVQIRFNKKIDGTYYVVEAVFENKHKKLWIQSAYLQKNEDVTQASDVGNVANPEMTAKPALASPSSNNIIPETESKVNFEADGLPARSDMAQKNEDVTQASAEGNTTDRGANAQSALAYPSSNDIIPKMEAKVNFETDELPIADKWKKQNKQQRKWVKTSTESDVVNREILPDDLDESKITYLPLSNKETLGKANTKLSFMGYETAIGYFNNQLYSQKVSVDDIALGERLIQEAIKNGDKKTAGELIQNMAILGTELGQKVQALSIINKMTPEGQLKMLQKVITRAKARGDRAFADVELSEEIADCILGVYEDDGSYDQRELDRAVEEAKRIIARELKLTKMEKVNAWRYLSMLGNPKTHIRNVVSNVAMLGTTKVKDVIARTIETFAPIGNRTKTWKASTDTVKAFAKQTANQMKSEIVGEKKYGDSSDIKSKRNIYKNQILQKAYNLNSELLEKEDWWFSKADFESSFREFLTANGIRTDEDIENNSVLIEKGKRYALERSEIATFRQYSWLANKITSIERKNMATQIAVGSIIPFKKTSINVAKAGFNYSPLGFAKTLTYDIKQVKKGEMEASELIDHLSQNLTGTGLALIGYLLAQMGFLNGAGDDDKEGTYDYHLGKQAYSVNIGGNTYSLSWISPAAMPVFVGVNAYEQLIEGKEWSADVVMQTLAQTLDPMSEMSFMSSLDDVLSSYDSGVEKFASIGLAGLSGYASQFVPTLLSHVAATLDDTKRTTRVSGDSSSKMIDEVVNQLKYKIPWLRQTLEPSTDIWGNEIKQSDNIAIRAADNFFAPWYEKEGISTAVDSDLKELYSMVGESNVLPKIPTNSITYGNEKYYMSAKEYTEFKKTYGQTANSLLEQLFSTDTYQNADWKDRADMVSDVYTHASDVAKKDFLAKKGVEYTNASRDNVPYYKENSIKGAIESDMTAAEYNYSIEEPEKHAVSKAVGGYKVYKLYTSELSKIKADRDESGNTVSGSRKKKVIEYINGLDASYGEKIVLFKSEYPSDNTYNYEIVDYLNSCSDLSYSDMETILTELGFKVDSKGNISW